MKCNCTICGSRFRVTVDRESSNGNYKEPRYCLFCRSVLEEVEKG